MTAIPPPPQPTVDAIWSAREAEEAKRPQYEGYGISASRLGRECDRDLWYGLRWASPPETFTGRKLRIFERGNIEEDRVVEDLRRAGIVVEGTQDRFQLARGWLRGKIDGRALGLLEAPKTEHVIEIKSMKAADWRAVQKHGLKAKKADHWHQLHSGVCAMALTRGAYIGVNKDTEEILVERINADVEEMARQEARVLRIVDNHDGPSRAGEKPEQFVCRFCDHKAVCHEGAFARRHCRTCIHFTFGDAPNGHCSRFDAPKTPAEQREGKHCPAHLYLPALVPGEQIDADPDAETITYQLPDGSDWIDGEERQL